MSRIYKVSHRFGTFPPFRQKKEKKNASQLSLSKDGTKRSESRSYFLQVAEGERNFKLLTFVSDWKNLRAFNRLPFVRSPVNSLLFPLHLVFFSAFFLHSRVSILFRLSIKSSTLLLSFFFPLFLDSPFLSRYR